MSPSTWMSFAPGGSASRLERSAALDCKEKTKALFPPETSKNLDIETPQTCEKGEPCQNIKSSNSECCQMKAQVWPKKKRKKTKIVVFQPWDLVSLGSLHPNRNGHRSSEAQCNSRPLQLGNATLLKKRTKKGMSFTSQLAAN